MWPLPLCSSVALTFYPDHIDPQQAVERFQSHTCHLRVFILHAHTYRQNLIVSSGIVFHIPPHSKMFHIVSSQVAERNAEVPSRPFLTCCTLQMCGTVCTCDNLQQALHTLLPQHLQHNHE